MTIDYPAFEPAARAYCQFLGLDPEAKIGHAPDPNPDGGINMVLILSPQWKLIARELARHHAMNAALAMFPPKLL